MYWQEKEDPKPVKIKIRAGDFYLKGFADAFHGRPRGRQPSKRAREAYANGYQAGQAARQRSKPGSSLW